MLEIETYVFVTKAITILVGGFVTLLAYRASTRTGSPALRALTAGLGLVTLGGFVAGAIHQLTQLSILVGIAVQSTFTAAGFIVLAYSLYASGPTSNEPDDAHERGSSGTAEP